jgi:hypothetical protein
MSSLFLANVDIIKGWVNAVKVNATDTDKKTIITSWV